MSWQTKYPDLGSWAVWGGAPEAKTWSKIKKGLPYAKTAGKFAAKGALLGAILPGQGTDNLIGGYAALGVWQLSRKAIKAKHPIALAAAAGTYGVVQGISSLFDQKTDITREEVRQRYDSESARKRVETNLSYYLPSFATDTSRSASGADKVQTRQVNIIKADDLLRTAVSDEKYTQQELTHLAALSTVGTTNNALIQVLDEKKAKQQLLNTVNWRNKQHAKQIQAVLAEPDALGHMGVYYPGTKVLGVNALLDPRDIGNLLGQAYVGSDDKKIAEYVARTTSPVAFEETTLHEGLHAVWDVDMDPAHKARFMREAQEQMSGSSFGEDVSALVEKAPVYANMVKRAIHGKTPRERALGTEMVANEMWAHRGVLNAYKDVGYTLGENKELDAITAQYVNWTKPKVDITPEFVGGNVESAIAAGGLTPAMWQYHRATSHQRMLPQLAGIRFSGKDDAYNQIPALHDGGMAAGVRHSLTSFGSGWNRDALQAVTVYGQDIDPRIQEFRAKWFTTPERRAELEKIKKELFIPPGEFKENELVKLASGRASVNLNAFSWKFEDPDTMVLKRKGLFNILDEPVKIRLTGIDSPEIEHPGDPTKWFRFHQEQPYGEEATELANELWGGRDDVQLTIDPSQESYGRHIGLASIPGEESINIQMIRKGIAAALPWGESGSDIYSREEFSKAEKEAQRANVGMWGEEYFQRYKDISGAVGKPITFNTFTDLSRLARNYSLAAAEQLMFREDIEYEPWMGKFIGSKLRKSYGPRQNSQRFSGKDDAYNTIEGLGHQGMASGTRRTLTDFGSGSIGAKVVNRAAKTFKGFSVSQIKQLAKAAKQETVEQFAERLGVELKSLPAELNIATGGGVNIASKTVSKKIPGGEKQLQDFRNQFKGIEAGKAYVDPDFVRGYLKTGTLKEDIDDTLKTFIFHEAAELKNVTAAAEKFSSKLAEGGSWQHTVTLPQEELFLRYFTKRTSSLRKGMEDWRVQQWPQYRFSGTDDAYNTIEGLKHQGLAPEVRHLLTEFGSGWDPLRKIAVKIFKGMDEVAAYNRLLKSRRFSEALKAGTKVKSIGRGGYGEATLFKTQIEGHKFQYVSKQAHIFDKNFSVVNKRNIESVKREYQALQDISGEITPTAYGEKLDSGRFFMEHMPGTPIRELHSAGANLPKQYIEQQVHREIRHVAGKGYANVDINMGNILFDPETRKVSWIDFGTVSRMSNTEMAVKQMTGSVKIGQELIGWTGNQFSGLDDAYNTIKGFGENGLAPEIRHTYTDFGSGWTRAVGKLFASLKKRLAAGAIEDISSWKTAWKEHAVGTREFALAEEQFVRQVMQSRARAAQGKIPLLSRIKNKMNEVFALQDGQREMRKLAKAPTQMDMARMPTLPATSVPNQIKTTTFLTTSREASDDIMRSGNAGRILRESSYHVNSVPFKQAHRAGKRHSKSFARR